MDGPDGEAGDAGVRGREALALVALVALAACTTPATVHREAQGALGPYSASVDAGALVFVSGQIGERGGTFEHEAATALDRVAAELERADLSLADVVSATVYLTDMTLYAPLNEVWAARVPAPHPARACVAVAALPGGARVEVQVVARR